MTNERNFGLGISDLKNFGAGISDFGFERDQWEQNVMTQGELKKRTKQFALRVMKLVDALPRSVSGRAVGNQLVRSGTAVGANFRAACRAQSRKEFLSRLGVVKEEADESGYWLELIADGELLKPGRVSALMQESTEITRIFAASIKTTRSSLKKSRGR